MSNRIEDSATYAGTGDYILVDEPLALKALTARVIGVDQVALDTEADSLHSYFEKVCLVQLSLSGMHYVVDPLRGLDLHELLSALAETRLIVHGGDYDLRIMRTSLGFRPRREVFDSMIAAQLLGFDQIGLAALVERYFAISLGKEGQKWDWSRRPLSERQLRYATNDTRFLEPLAERLRRDLHARGRLEWHEESCRAMVQASARDRPRDPADIWRIKGSGRLTRGQLVYLRELWKWRDRQAQRRDVPAFKVLGNQQLIELAVWADSHPGAVLTAGPKLPRNIRGELLAQLQAAVERAAAISESQWPDLKRSGDAKRARDYIPALEALRAECARIAKSLEIAPSIVAPRAALEAIVLGRVNTVEEIMQRSGLLRWQARLVESAVERAQKRLSITE
jgi:ribonuclease D